MAKEEESASDLIDEKIAKLGDWRGDTLARLRALIRDAEPGVTETGKWRKPSDPLGVPVGEQDGILCTGETYKEKVNLTCATGAAPGAPARSFHAYSEHRKGVMWGKRGSDRVDPGCRRV